MANWSTRLRLRRFIVVLSRLIQACARHANEEATRRCENLFRRYFIYFAVWDEQQLGFYYLLRLRNISVCVAFSRKIFSVCFCKKKKNWQHVCIGRAEIFLLFCIYDAPDLTHSYKLCERVINLEKKNGTVLFYISSITNLRVWYCRI